MDPPIKFYKAFLLQQSDGFDIPVFVLSFRYQYGQGLGDVLHGILQFIPKVARFFQQVVIICAQTLLKADSEAIMRVPR